jgi:hypothetical protein
MTALCPATLEAALQLIFGGRAADIHVSHLDHLCGTLTPPQVELLLRAVGGPWSELLDRVGEKRAATAGTKDPGPDVRNMSDEDRAAYEKAKRRA